MAGVITLIPQITGISVRMLGNQSTTNKVYQMLFNDSSVDWVRQAKVCKLSQMIEVKESSEIKRKMIRV